MNSEDEIDNIDFSSTNDENFSKFSSSTENESKKGREHEIDDYLSFDGYVSGAENFSEGENKREEECATKIIEKNSEGLPEAYNSETLERQNYLSLDENMDYFMLSSVLDIENISTFEQFSDIEDQKSGTFKSNEDSDDLFDTLEDNVVSKKVKINDDNGFNNVNATNCEAKQDVICKSTTNKRIVSGFSTGNNNKIVINNISNKDPKIMFSHGGGPIRTYNKPEKGHISQKNEEKNRYISLFKQITCFFKSCNLKWLKIQFRWVWIHLYLNNQLKESSEIKSMIKEHIKIRKENEFSILKRILEGDEISYRYMILLIVGIYKNIIEAYDGSYSVRIEVDDIIFRSIKENKISVGTRIRLFGCKYLLTENADILDLDDETVVLKASYNSFGYCFADRKLGYRKKISFRKDIMSIHKEGGPISCIVGIVKRIVEIKYVVQVKGYRNVVTDLQKELEKLEIMIEKTQEDIKKENIKIKKYIKFVFTDKTGECLITSWMNIDNINRGDRIMFCYLLPLTQYVGIHLTTAKYTFMKCMQK